MIDILLLSSDIVEPAVDELDAVSKCEVIGCEVNGAV